MKKRYLAITIAMMTSNAMLSNPALAAAHLLPELGSLNASTAGAGSAALAEIHVNSMDSEPCRMSQLENPELTVNLAGLYTDINYSDTNPTERFDWLTCWRLGSGRKLLLCYPYQRQISCWFCFSFSRWVGDQIMVIAFLNGVY